MLTNGVKKNREKKKENKTPTCVRGETSSEILVRDGVQGRYRVPRHHNSAGETKKKKLLLKKRVKKFEIRHAYVRPAYFYGRFYEVQSRTGT